MKLSRRSVLQLAAGAAALPLISRLAAAQAYPSRPVRIIVGFPPGSGVDVVARLIAPSLSERLGQPFVVENRPGAGSNIATEAVVRAPPDGYTLLWVGPPVAINATLYDKLNFNFLRDIAPVAGINREPNVMLVNPAFEAKTVPAFIAYAKANPGKISMASVGNGSVSHVAGELFKMMAGVDMVHVPYRGSGPALTDLIGGRVQVLFTTTSASMPFIKSGQVRALGRRHRGARRGAAGPAARERVRAGLRGEQFLRRRRAAERRPPTSSSGSTRRSALVLAEPKMKARLAELGATVMPLSPADFRKLVADETEKWAKVVKFSGARPD